MEHIKPIVERVMSNLKERGANMSWEGKEEYYESMQEEMEERRFEFTIKTLKEELWKIQKAESECIDEYGVIKHEHKYRYKMLVEQAVSFRQCIEYLEKFGKEVE